jgi:chromosome partitioning protein
MLGEASDYPLLIVPTMVPRSPSASLNRRLWEMAQCYDVPIGPVVSWYADLGERQPRIAMTAVQPTSARWSRYVDELRAVAEASDLLK